MWFFLKLTAIHPLKVGEQTMPARDLSVQSLLLIGHFLNATKPSSDGEGKVAINF